MKALSRRQWVTRVAALAAAALPREARADQRHMDAALDALRSAERELKAAMPDKGGHRGKAIQLVKDAILQVERGINYARRH